MERTQDELMHREVAKLQREVEEIVLGQINLAYIQCETTITTHAGGLLRLRSRRPTARGDLTGPAFRLDYGV